MNIAPKTQSADLVALANQDDTAATPFLIAQFVEGLP
jgi:hypothetical protein